jgi:DNA-binding transcriptional MerR regulator
MQADKAFGEPRLRIGELAELAGTTTRAIRYYHSIGLLSEAARDDSGYRRYGPDHLVRLVRIRRLRALDMPLEQIAAHLSDASAEPGDLQASLRSLAEDITRQIDELQALRQRVLDLAAAKGAAPTEVWQAALRTHGLLDDSAALPGGEHEAITLLDALHPDGIEGVIEQSSALLADSALARQLEPLLERFRSLADDELALEELAVAAAALLPRPERAAPPVDFETMDKLLGDRFTSAQRRFLRRLRQLLEGGDG